MGMTHHQRKELIYRLERSAHQHPARYRFQVGLLVALGYAYFFLVFALLGGLIWGLRELLTHQGEVSSGSLNWLTVFLAIAVGRMFWVSAPINDLDISSQQAPELFAVIDQLTQKLSAPRFHRVFLTSELNAGVLQVPRLGFLGWQKNYLFLGLPLMQALSPEQFTSTLAHELAHLSGNDSRFHNWIYRLRNTWYLLVGRFSNQGGAVLYAPLSKWYMPFFQAYSFVLARANEYTADRRAAQLVSLSAIADKLKHLYIQSHVWQKFWEATYQQAAQQATPPEGAIEKLLQTLQAGLDAKETQIWLELALAQQTGIEDTHPSLSDRLQALGYQSAAAQRQLPTPVEKTAAQHFLGGQLPALTCQLDHHWQQQMRLAWERLHRRLKGQLQHLETLEAKAQKQSLTPEEGWNFARLTAILRGKEAAIPLFQAVLAQRPQHPAAHYGLGELLLEQQDSRGMTHLESAIAQDPSLVSPGCRLLFEFLYRQGQIEAARSYLPQIQDGAEQWEQAREERQQFKSRDRFVPHQLPNEEIQQLSEQLSRYPDVQTAYLVQKVVPHFPEKPLYILGIMRRFTPEKTDNDLFDQLTHELNLSEDFMVAIFNVDYRNLWQAVRRVPGALIFQAKLPVRFV
jgi:Zn-dependent protease with chaperone function